MPDSPTRAATLVNVVIHVSDMDRALRFYREALQLAVRFDSGENSGSDLLALSATPADTRIRIVGFESSGSGGLALCSFGSEETTAPYDFERTGTVHVGLEVADVDQTLKRAAQFGGAPFGRPGIVGPPGRKSKLGFLRDPDGTVIELVEHILAAPQTTEASA